MNIVATHIVMDVLGRKPGIVTITVFNNRGEKNMEVVLNGDLFPTDLKVGDNLMFAKKEGTTTANDNPLSLTRNGLS